MLFASELTNGGIPDVNFVHDGEVENPRNDAQDDEQRNREQLHSVMDSLEL